MVIFLSIIYFMPYLSCEVYLIHLLTPGKLILKLEILSIWMMSDITAWTSCMFQGLITFTFFRYLIARVRIQLFGALLLAREKLFGRSD